MKLKSGFTIVEMLIIVVVIAILAGITYGGYASFQARAVTNQNRFAAEEVVQKMGTFRLDKSKYPDGLGSLENDNDLISLLSDQTRKRVQDGLTLAPSAINPANLSIHYCTHNGKPNVSIGAKVNYWDVGNKKLVTLDFGNSKSSDAVCKK